MRDNKVESYIEQLSSEHADQRDSALAWLLDHPALSRPALRKLASAGVPDPPTLAAVYLLGRMGDESDVALLSALVVGQDSRLKWESAQALGQHASPLAEQVLITALKHGEPEAVGAAAIALGLRGSEAARPSLEELLKHPNEGARYRAVLALRRLGIAASARSLRAHRENEASAEVREAIDEALKAER